MEVPLINQVDGFGRPVELAEKRMGDKVGTTSRGNYLRIFAMNEVTEGFNFSTSEMLRLQCKTNVIRHR